MSGSTARREAIAAIANAPEIRSTFDYKTSPTGEVWAQNVYSMDEMSKRLPKGVYKSLKTTIETGGQLDPGTADAVAESMKTWALDHGATHYAHVFFPLTGQTAEKHDSFFDPDGRGGTISTFEGSSLIQGEPDGSSFPTGGIRQTFEARGYTIWDVTSPAYIMENPNGTTLCIPTAFVSWTGEALDHKTPLLRSMQALNEQAQRVLKFFGNDGPFVAATAGAEQEYFLIDQNFYYARPDLMAADRTLFGAPPPKGQEFDDHYFGVIPQRVLAFMFEVERELFKLGVPTKTRHNEVAPGQYELAPVYESANTSADHQQIIMIALRKMAEKYGMTCLLHEKPFGGINGSGKHLNFSMGSAAAGNLFEPGATPSENAQFLLFCSAMIRAVYKWSKILRASIAYAGNDHRLGANEAPPAILSIFLGDELTQTIESIATGKPIEAKRGTLTVGADVIPPIPKHSGDRNRTSPMAFTGNKFEFRAVGASQSIAVPLTTLSTAMAESLDYCAGKLESADTSSKQKLGSAIADIVREIWNECSSVVFNGDNYTQEWHKEAQKRGLPNLRTTADALPAYTDHDVIELFAKYGVLTERETEARYEVYAEQYIAAVNVESNLVVEMARSVIFPAAVRYQGELAGSLASLKAVGIDTDSDTLATLTRLIKSLQDSVAQLASLKEQEDSLDDVAKHCVFLRDQVLPKMLEIRGYVDELEGYVADDLWPLPTYQEMLFIK